MSGFLQPDPVLATAQRGDLVGVETYCPVHDCDYRQSFASAKVVNEYGVEDVLPKYCRHHRVAMRIGRIVEVIRGDGHCDCTSPVGVVAPLCVGCQEDSDG